MRLQYNKITHHTASTWNHACNRSSDYEIAFVVQNNEFSMLTVSRFISRSMRKAYLDYERARREQLALPINAIIHFVSNIICDKRRRDSELLSCSSCGHRDQFIVKNVARTANLRPIQNLGKIR